MAVNLDARGESPHGGITMEEGGHGSGSGDGAGHGHGGSSEAAAGRPDPVAMLEQAVAAVEPIVAKVRPDQMNLPTPCTDWTVRDVIDHVVKGNAWVVATMASDSGSAPRPTGDTIGNDPAAAFAETSARMVAAFKEPAARGKMVDLPFGRMPGVAFAGFCMGDLLVHGWDIARATGQPTDFAPELNEAALAAARRTMTFDRAGSPFAPEQPVAADAAAADRFAAFLGRAA